MKPSDKLSRFYAELLDENAYDEAHPRAEQEDATERLERHERRKRWTRPPYHANRKKTLGTFVHPGFEVEGTYWTPLTSPYRKQCGRYPKRFVKARCRCGREKEVRLDSLTRLRPDGVTLSRWCRSCAMRHRWQTNPPRGKK